MVVFHIYPLNIFSVSVLANDSITLVYYHAMILSSSTLFELQIYFGVGNG